MPLIKQCICGSTEFKPLEMHSIHVNKCICGIIHQNVEKTEQELYEWYKNYHNGIYSHSYEQDRKVASIRLNSYQKWINEPILDIGCGNGAFVDECRDNGLTILGQDIGGNADLHGPVEEITDRFKLVTLHDVLEHVPDIRRFLNHIRQITEGHLIVDFPNFFSDEGMHHWKETEHLWMLTEFQLMDLLAECGFYIVEIWQPVPGKFTVVAK